MGIHYTVVQGWIFMFLEQGIGPYPVELEYRHAFHDLYDDFIVYFGCMTGGNGDARRPQEEEKDRVKGEIETGWEQALWI